MKSMWCTLWILGALVFAMLDTAPDPPALNPTTRLSERVQVHDYSCDTLTQTSDSICTSNPFPVGLAVAEAREPHSPGDPMVLAGQAADPSPPAPQAGPEKAFRS